MTTNTDVVNQALQVIGTRTTITDAQLAAAANGQPASSCNEAIQANLIMFRLRDNLNRMAPWNCVTKWAPLVYISSLPGTPENMTAAAPLWQRGIPPAPWVYEYQYPNDCVRFRKIIPPNTNQNTGIPIYPPNVTTGMSAVGWNGPPQRFEVATDTFQGLSGAIPLSVGVGYAVGDIITLNQPNYTFTQAGVSYTMPVGAPAQLLVTSVDGTGAVLAVTIISQIAGEGVSATNPTGTPIGGSYFSIIGADPTQGSTTGVGTGATFTLGGGSLRPQRVVLTNQEQAIGCYNQQLLDTNVMDQQFVDAWAAILGARLSPGLNGDKALAHEALGVANSLIMEARKGDGNEGVTINDVVPDFIRTRGIMSGPNWEFSPNLNVDWGPVFGY